MSEQLHQPHQTIPAREFSSPERKEDWEAQTGTPLGTHAYEFDSSQYAYLLGADTLGQGVV